jgi:uncharacterized protein involved in propanediol utilization
MSDSARELRAYLWRKARQQGRDDTVASRKASREQLRINGGGDQDERPLQVGIGRAIAHHGELLQGVFEGEDGRLHRGLATLPLASQQALATFWPRDKGGIRVRPASKIKAARATALTLEHLGFKGKNGDLTIESAIPVGHGYGSSTADVIASIRAAAAAVGVALRRSTVSCLAVAAEGASDAIAYGDQALLFAHREGQIIEHFGGEFPPLIVVGFRSSKRPPIDTLQLPRARYTSEEIQLFRVMRGLAYHSVKQQDPRLLGRVATMSARISQRYLPKPRFEAVMELAQDHRACGVQVAHSGTLIGILLDADAREAVARAPVLAAKVTSAGFRDVMTFTLNAEKALTK